MKLFNRKLFHLAVCLIIGLQFLISCSSSSDTKVFDKSWPPELPTANENGMATLNSADLLTIPNSVQHILDSTVNAKLVVAEHVPTVELSYHTELPHAAFNGTGWSSWGDILVASDGKVYSGTGNHWGIDSGETYVYSWDPSIKRLKKIADINQLTKARPGDIRFSKVHAHIIEGNDKKIYFTGTLDDGGKAGNKEMLERWNDNIAGGKLFQYDPATGESVVYADFPAARVTATMKYDPIRNLLYCALEGSPEGFALGVFDMSTREWIYKGKPGEISGQDRNFILDSKGNLYFNGPESFIHTGIRLKNLLEAWQKKKTTIYDQGKYVSPSMLPGIKRRLNKESSTYTTLMKYDPRSNKVTPTNSYFKSIGFRSSTKETKEGYVYGSTMGGELFRYSPSNDELILLGSNFLVEGEYITVCDLSPDEKYVYYLPGAHGSAGFSGTPVIQYNIKNGQQKALAFLYEPMNKVFNYAPGGTYGMKVSEDGTKLYIGLNGSPSETLRPKGLHEGFGLTSFVTIHIPEQER